MFSKNEKKFSQSFANTYHDAGQFYFAHKNTFRKKLRYFLVKQNLLFFLIKKYKILIILKIGKYVKKNLKY